MKITENWEKANSDPQRWRHRSIREYHDWQWDEGEGDPCYPHAQTKFSPDWSGFESDPFCTRSKQTTGLLNMQTVHAVSRHKRHKSVYVYYAVHGVATHP